MDDTVGLVLCDHDLPDMDGPELATTLRDRGWDDVPIVIMSANPGLIHADPAHRLIKAVLQKPIPRAELYSRLMALDTPLFAPGQPREGDTSEAQPDQARAGQRQMRVLAAEDNRTNQLILGKMTKDLDIELRFVANGVEAVDAYSDFDPDLIFMDISMPKMDGKQATAEIRRIEVGTGRHVPVVALTAHAMAGDDRGILAAGLDHYLTKPLHKKLICQMIKDHCPQAARPVIADPRADA